MIANRSRITRSVLVAGTVAASIVLTGCGDNGDDAAQDTTTPMTTLPMTTTQPTTTPATSPTNGAEISSEASQQLCDMIEPELDNWRDQGSTIAKTTFNGTVQNWAARNELTDDVVQDKTIVDTVTTQTCPDVRQQALEVLEVPDLASALVGFGG
ncbi:hypothetical protein APR12_003159 [Nocardia amikacinitolerans]|uniref:hypothetical protein n=1 Tax=Nocardia amikacinitolerans TaxID=756689 RepID=UPI000829F738|nr:hypothetical protein [Nocardia amikacinitolerans]MCP2317806.1 hypothetical protein [Nocardia amikacinitolerans]